MIALFLIVYPITIMGKENTLKSYTYKENHHFWWFLQTKGVYFSIPMATVT